MIDKVDTLVLNDKHKALSGYKQLVAHNLLSKESADALVQAEPGFASLISKDMAALIPQDVAQRALDPIAMQFVPSIKELEVGSDELSDPLGDGQHMPVKGIVHRHKDRCLLLPIATCAVYCRFCFRKEQIGPGFGALSDAELELAFGYIASHSELYEVILSGGDPLMLKPAKLHAILQRLRDISHVKVIRLHTRIPIVDSKRMQQAYFEVLSQHAPLYMVLHINHIKELHANARQVIDQLRSAGVILLSQSVLLKGINDSVDVLEQLMRELVSIGIKPYYIHQLDPARGVSHFKVDASRGVELMRQLRLRCSGLCQPLYVQDVHHGKGCKWPVTD